LPWTGGRIALEYAVGLAWNTHIEPQTASKSSITRRALMARLDARIQRIDCLLRDLALEIKEINPARLRQRTPRHRKARGAIRRTMIYNSILRKPIATSAIRLMLHNCGDSSCSGCPHAKWGAWRLLRTQTGKRRNVLVAVKSRESVIAYARHAPARQTLALVKRAFALLDEKARLVDGFRYLGRVGRTRSDLPNESP
jgi:hypothetical protein